MTFNIIFDFRIFHSPQSLKSFYLTKPVLQLIFLISYNSVFISIEDEDKLVSSVRDGDEESFG